MLNAFFTPATLLHDLRRKLLAKPATLPAIFQTGDRILAASADPAAFPANLPSPRVAILGSVTLDYLTRANVSSKLPWITLPEGMPTFSAHYDARTLWPAASLERRKAALG